MPERRGRPVAIGDPVGTAADAVGVRAEHHVLGSAAGVEGVLAATLLRHDDRDRQRGPAHVGGREDGLRQSIERCRLGHDEEPPPLKVLRAARHAPSLEDALDHLVGDRAIVVGTDLAPGDDREVGIHPPTILASGGPTLRLSRDSFAGRPALDTALSRALLERASAGELAETLRIWRPDTIVTFGRLDAVAAGYHEALDAAHREGFAAVERLEGGRAAVFHEQTVAFAHTVPDPHPMENTHARFEATAELMAAALARLGVDARVGEVPREYCPGAYSVNAGGRRKLVGVGQRVIARAAHVGGVIIVAQSERVRAVLEPVYRALGLDWDPATAGAVDDELGDVTYEQVEAAILAEYAHRYELVETPLDEDSVALAAALEGEYEAPSRTSSLGGVGATHP